MVVVPTSRHVTLSYGTTTVDWIGKAASVAGLVGLGALAFRPAPDVGTDPAAADPVTASPLPNPAPTPAPGPQPGGLNPPAVWGEPSRWDDVDGDLLRPDGGSP